MIIKSIFKNYEVSIEHDLNFVNELLVKPNSFFVVDKKLLEFYPQIFSSISSSQLFLVEAIEENKIVDIALDICERMTEIPAKRNANLISFGGGIIQDITGFVANILYRGIKWDFIPTTLLAASDSCIGGKTSLNYKHYKNLLGTFYPPDSIHICPAFFKTLSERDFKSGLGEVIKFNIMAGEKGLKNIEENIGLLLERDEKTLNSFVESSLAFKKTFIEADEFDKGERIKLNFAHTFGHAIESITNYEIPHGTAVAIGMIMADSLSLKRGILLEETVKRSEKILLSVIDIDIDLSSYEIDSFINAMRKDKKQTSESITAVLMTNDAKDLRICKDISADDVRYALDYFVSLYKNK